MTIPCISVPRLLLVAACALATVGLLSTTSTAEVLPPRVPLEQLPMTFAGWRGTRQADLAPEVLAVLGAEDYVIRTYQSTGQPPVGLYVGYHASQRQGDTIHSPLNCLPGAGWQPLEQGRSRITVAGVPGSSAPATIEVNRVVIGKGLDRQLVLYWYQSHRRVVASEYWGKVYTVLDSVRYRRTDAALVRVITPIDESETSSSDERAHRFVQELFPRLAVHLPS